MGGSVSCKNPGSMPRMGPTQQTGSEGNKRAMYATGRLEQKLGKGGKTNYCNSQFAGPWNPNSFGSAFLVSLLALKLWEGKLIPINNCGCITAKWDKRFILIKRKVIPDKELWLTDCGEACKMLSWLHVGVWENCKMHVAKRHIKLSAVFQAVYQELVGGVTKEIASC